MIQDGHRHVTLVNTLVIIQVQCYGTPFFLKARFGSGYTLVVNIQVFLYLFDIFLRFFVCIKLFSGFVI